MPPRTSLSGDHADRCNVCVDWARKAAEAHAQAFHLAKAPRKLAFAPALGIVELELVVGTATLNFSVSPVLACIILPFQEHESMSAVDLEKATNIPMDVLLRKCDLPPAL